MSEPKYPIRRVPPSPPPVADGVPEHVRLWRRAMEQLLGRQLTAEEIAVLDTEERAKEEDPHE